MPSCPGCGLIVPHERLGTHERYCDKLGDDAGTDSSVEVLERQITEVEERLTRRLLKLETRLQYELSNRQNSHQSREEPYNPR